MSNSLRLKKFDPSQIPSNSVVMCIGKRGTGKTTLTADILYHQRKCFDAGIAFSATEESNNYWSRHICDTLIHQDLSKNICQFHCRAKKNQFETRASDQFLCSPGGLYVQQNFKDRCINQRVVF